MPRFDLVIIDEFGFDKIERAEAPQAASLLYKIIDARSQQAQPHWSPTSTSKLGANTSVIRRWQWPSSTASWTAPSS